MQQDSFVLFFVYFYKVKTLSIKREGLQTSAEMDGCCDMACENIRQVENQ